MTRTSDFAGYHTPEKVGRTRRVTPEGYLVLKGTPVARSGMQLYRAAELPGLEPDGAGMIRVERPPEEVFHPDSLASYEGKDFTLEHPPEGVDTTNWKQHAVGHMQNVRRGTGPDNDLVLADIVIKDPLAIAYVNKNLPDISAGYGADYEQTAPGRAIQHNIRANHSAAVMRGRAGSRVSVRDHIPQAARTTLRLDGSRTDRQAQTSNTLPTAAEINARNRAFWADR